MEPTEIPPEMFQLFVVNLAIAIACGGMIGIERQLRRKAAGLRVCILVVMTTAFFITIAQEVAPGGAEGQLRILGSIITGVGFLGAGVIFRGSGQVSGITTATLIWALAAVGCTIGFGYGWVAVVATLVIMGVLGLIDAAEHLFPRLKRPEDPRRAPPDA